MGSSFFDGSVAVFRRRKVCAAGYKVFLALKNCTGRDGAPSGG